MENKELITLNGKQYPKGLNILMREENLIDDFVFKFIPYLIFPTSDKFPWFPILIDGKSVFISTSIKAIVKVKRQYSSLKPKLGILKVLIHKTDPVCYIPREEISGPFYLVTHNLYEKNKKATRKTSELNKTKQSQGKEPKSGENYFSLIGDSIVSAVGIFVFLKHSFCDLFKKEEEGEW